MSPSVLDNFQFTTIPSVPRSSRPTLHSRVWDNKRRSSLFQNKPRTEVPSLNPELPRSSTPLASVAAMLDDEDKDDYNEDECEFNSGSRDGPKDARASVEPSSLPAGNASPGAVPEEPESSIEAQPDVVMTEPSPVHSPKDRASRFSPPADSESFWETSHLLFPSIIDPWRRSPPPDTPARVQWTWSSNGPFSYSSQITSSTRPPIIQDAPWLASASLQMKHESSPLDEFLRLERDAWSKAYDKAQRFERKYVELVKKVDGSWQPAMKAPSTETSMQQPTPPASEPSPQPSTAPESDTLTSTPSRKRRRETPSPQPPEEQVITRPPIVINRRTGYTPERSGRAASPAFSLGGDPTPQHIFPQGEIDEKDDSDADDRMEAMLLWTSAPAPFLSPKHTQKRSLPDSEEEFERPTKRIAAEETWNTPLTPSPIDPRNPSDSWQNVNRPQSLTKTGGAKSQPVPTAPSAMRDNDRNLTSQQYPSSVSSPYSEAQSWPSDPTDSPSGPSSQGSPKYRNSFKGPGLFQRHFSQAPSQRREDNYGGTSIPRGQTIEPFHASHSYPSNFETGRNFKHYPLKKARFDTHTHSSGEQYRHSNFTNHQQRPRSFSYVRSDQTQHHGWHQRGSNREIHYAANTTDRWNDQSRMRHLPPPMHSKRFNRNRAQSHSGAGSYSHMGHDFSSNA